MANVTLIQNFSLPGEICRKFALNWSADNKISVCTNKAIYILSSNCSPVESGFPSPLHKQVIKISEQPMQLNPIDIPFNPYKYITSEQDRDVLHRFLMDHTLNPKPTERAETFLSFRCCRWSPRGAAKGDRCLLATLSMDHRLCLYEEREEEWQSVCDLTEILKLRTVVKTEVPVVPAKSTPQKLTIKRKKHKKKKMNKNSKKAAKEVENNAPVDEIEEITILREEETENTHNPSTTLKKFCIKTHIDLGMLREKAYKIAPMEILWTGMFGTPSTPTNESSSEYCFLIVAMKSGHIQFWKVSANNAKTVSLTHEWDTGLGMLTSLCWQQTSQNAGFLMCGSLKGVLSFLPISINVGGDQEPRVTIKSMCKVWDEEDSIAVDHIAVLKIALKKYVIIAAKMHALVGCEIVQTDDSIIIRNVGHSFGLHRLPVTGMAVLDTTMPQYKILMATMEGVIVEIKVSLGNDEIKFQHEKVSVDLDLRNNMVQGLSVSANGLLCAMILNTATYFDHLVNKEPLQFVMFVTRPFEEVYSKLKNILKPQFSFMPSASNIIRKHTDFLEFIRTNLACDTPLPDWLTAFLDKDPSTFENCSSIELYFMRFIMHAYVSGLATTIPEDKGNLEQKMHSVEAAIMKNYVSKVFGRCQDNIDLLTPGQGQSLLLMADWLLQEFQMSVESLYSALGSSTPEDTLPARETCTICKGEVRLDDLKVGRCANNHEFARCCHSLLLCDIVPYLRCSSCKSVALKGMWNSGTLCTYCGMPMT